MTALLDFPGPGIHYDMPADVYHRIKALSKSTALSILRSPAHYWEALKAGESDTQTKSRLMGSALHCLILEPEAFNSRYLFVADGVTARTTKHRALVAMADSMVTFDKSFIVATGITSRNAKAYKEMAAGSDRTVVLESEFDFLLDLLKLPGPSLLKANGPREIILGDNADHLRMCADSIRRHPACAEILKDAHTEVSIFWRDAVTDVPCKARLDVLTPTLIGDPKTTDDASPGAFRLQVSRMKYHAQDAHYRRAVSSALGESLPLLFIAAELTEPYGVMVYELPDDAIEAGGLYMDDAAMAYADMLNSEDQYTGYPTEVVQLNIPYL